MIHKFVKYILVGVVNTIFGYSLFALFIYLGMHYSLAVLFSTLMGIIFNFKTTGSLVFNSNNNALIYKFFVVYAITYGLNVMGLNLLIKFDFNTYLAGMLMLVPTTIISFLLNSEVVFREKSV